MVLTQDRKCEGQCMTTEHAVYAGLPSGWFTRVLVGGINQSGPYQAPWVVHCSQVLSFGLLNNLFYRRN